MPRLSTRWSVATLCMLIALISTGWVPPAQAQYLDPGRSWRTAETPNFRIHFEGETRVTAQRVGDIAERAFILMTRELSWTPRAKVDLVLYSGVDLANGFATPLPFNLSGIFITAPNDGELLDRADWLELVILHELTHIVHLDKVAGAPSVFRYIFGRNLWTFPNALQPRWLVEGLATHSESRAGNGIGRLHSAAFEAQMRDERRRGFLTLAQLNADGRNLPLNRNYLYGAYFFDYLTRTYGQDAAAQMVMWYSRQILPFRVHNSTYQLTKKQMDVVWSDFIDDLTKQIDARSAALRATPERIGEPLAESQWSVDAMAVAPNGDVYAVVDDGIGAPALTRYRAGGKIAESLATVHRGARINVRSDGAVLIAQPEVCGSYETFYDLYRWTDGGLLSGGVKRLTHCGRYLRAAWLGTDGSLVAIRNDRNGMTSVELLPPEASPKTLIAGDATRQWIDIATSADALTAVLIAKRAGSFELVRLDLASGTSTLLHTDADPKVDLHTAADGAILFVSTAGGAPNVWRLANNRLTRLTHAHTAVTQFGGMSADGTLGLTTLEGGKEQLRTLNIAARDMTNALETRAASTQGTSPPPALLAPAPTPVTLAAERGYNPLPSLLPRAWWPLIGAEKGTVSVGASIYGADALGMHSYLLSPLYEITQGEALGQAEYAYRERHFFSVARELNVRRSATIDGSEEPVEYVRTTQAQWVSLARAVRMQRQAALGLGAAMARREGVLVDNVVVSGVTQNGRTNREIDERIAAAVALYDSRGVNWLSEGPSRGQRLQFFYETYRPFKDAAGFRYTGEVLRANWDGYLPLGRTVLAAHWAEGRSQRGTTEPFQLGGSGSLIDTLAPQLNERDISLRGYRTGEPLLRGANARRVTLEWRTPIADIDRHAMVPPVGLNRVSGALFYEGGGAWTSGGGPEQWFRAVGVELLGELRLGYLFGIRLRLGVAWGLDTPGETRAYLQGGRSF
jgi:hypothetical protein